MKKKKVVIISILVAILVVISVLIGIYFYGLTPVSKDSKEVKFNITEGMGKIEIIDKLKEADLIKSKFSLYIYVALNRDLNLQAGEYILNKNMDAKEILNKFHKGEIIEEKNTYSLTFIEGKRLIDYASVIASAANTTEEEVMAILNNKENINEWIEKYWFLTEDILKEEIYYPLEGYLFASTYDIYNGSNAKTIIERMLDGTSIVLSAYKEDIEKSKYSIHEILTLASIIQNEGKTRDFANVSSVFHNRLNKGMKLESCATSYYGAKKDFSSMGIANNALISAKNPYNTYYISKLPIGPISSPSKMAIEAALRPTETNYEFFLSDNEGVTYFFATYREHQQKQRELIAAGKWAR